MALKNIIQIGEHQAKPSKPLVLEDSRGHPK